MMRHWFLFLSIFFAANAFAMFCPTNFKSIDIGDSIEKIQQDCGPPTSISNVSANSGGAQEWSYYVKTKTEDESTQKMTVVFKDDKVININLTEDSKVLADNCEAILAAGINSPLIQTACNKSFRPQQGNVASTDVCGGRTIRVGDGSEVVENACGKPLAINPLQQGGGQNPATQITEFKYDGPNPATLVFEGGRLKERRA